MTHDKFKYRFVKLPFQCCVYLLLGRDVKRVSTWGSRQESGGKPAVNRYSLHSHTSWPSTSRPHPSHSLRPDCPFASTFWLSSPYLKNGGNTKSHLTVPLWTTDQSPLFLGITQDEAPRDFLCLFSSACKPIWQGKVISIDLSWKQKKNEPSGYQAIISIKLGVSNCLVSQATIHMKEALKSNHIRRLPEERM